MTIIYSTIRTLILDKIIHVFFDNVAISFSKFDLLNGIREFDEIHFHDLEKNNSLHSICYECEIKSCFFEPNGKLSLVFNCMCVKSNITGNQTPYVLNAFDFSGLKIISVSDKILKLGV